MSPVTRRQVSPEKPARSAPAWVGATVLGGCALSLALFGWWFFFGSLPRERAVTLKPVPAHMPRHRASALRHEGTDRWVLRSHGAGMSIWKEKDAYEFRPFYAARMLVDPADEAYFAAYTKLRRDPALAKQLGLTAEQVKKLRSLRRPSMLVSGSEMQRLKTLWMRYVEQSPGSGQRHAERKLVLGFDEIAKAAFPASKRAAAEQVAQLRRVITPAILTKLSAVNSPAARAGK